MTTLIETQDNEKENAETVLLGFYSLMYVFGAVMIVTYIQRDTLLFAWMLLYPIALIVLIGFLSMVSFIYRVTKALEEENINDPALQRVFDAIGMYLYHPARLKDYKND